MAEKKRKRFKAVIFIDSKWLTETGMAPFLDLQGHLERAIVPSVPILVTAFNMEDGYFLEMEYYAPTGKGEILVTASIPKHAVILVQTGDIESTTGFKKL